MKEELTTLMHMEFCKDEEERREIAAMAMFADVFEHKRISFEKALQEYALTEEQFYEYMPCQHIFDFPKESLENLEKKWYGYITKEKHEKYKACKNKFEICNLFVSFYQR